MAQLLLLSSIQPSGDKPYGNLRVERDIIKTRTGFLTTATEWTSWAGTSAAAHQLHECSISLYTTMQTFDGLQAQYFTVALPGLVSRRAKCITNFCPLLSECWVPQVGVLYVSQLSFSALETGAFLKTKTTTLAPNTAAANFLGLAVFFSDLRLRAAAYVASAQNLHRQN